jgi:hypothetical protein
LASPFWNFPFWFGFTLLYNFLYVLTGEKVSPKVSPVPPNPNVTRGVMQESGDKLELSEDQLDILEWLLLELIASIK